VGKPGRKDDLVADPFMTGDFATSGGLKVFAKIMPSIGEQNGGTEPEGKRTRKKVLAGLEPRAA